MAKPVFENSKGNGSSAPPGLEDNPGKGSGVNHAPVIADQSFQVDENSGVTIPLAVGDPNNGQTLNCSFLSGNEAGLFVLDPVTGVISLAPDAAR